MMILKILPSFLLSTSFLLVCLTNLCNASAPADLPSGCQNVSTNQRALLDSCCYPTLLPASEGTWSAVDADEDGMTWTAQTSGLPNCSQMVMINDAGDDWLITQYINTTLDSGVTASEVEVDIQFTCVGDCLTNLDVLHYPVDSEQSQPFNRPLNASFESICPVTCSSDSYQVTGITTAGFYLALRATGNISVTVDQISIILTVCEEQTVALINFPEAYHSSTSVRGTCVANSNTSGSPTGTCGDSGTWATSSSCVCDPGYFLDSETCQACGMGTYKSTAGNETCSLCPPNSMATTEGSTICECRANYVRPNSNAANESCSGCESGYFLNNGMCRDCPSNSESTDPLSNSCICKGSSVTMGQANTTTMDDCSNCPVNWRASMTTPVVCERCPVRSERPENGALTICSCTDNYEMKGGQCVARVEIPQGRLKLNEGSAVSPAEIPLRLSATSYGFNVAYNIIVEPMYQDRISPSSSVFVRAGVMQAVISIMGDDEPLTPSFNLTVNVQPSSDYIGEGAIEVTIVDDDFVSVGFLVSQRTVFNESENNINIVLTKNATTAQDIMVNVVVPQGTSVSAEQNPIRVPANSDENIPVMLRIQDDVSGGEADESITLTLQLVSPTGFEHLIDVSDQLTIVIGDDDPPPTSTMLALGLTEIIGIAVAGGALLILIIIAIFVLICICRFNANRQGFYVTDEDKSTNPPSMLRYSASLRSISSQTVVPIIDGKGQIAEKENEFYV